VVTNLVRERSSALKPPADRDAAGAQEAAPSGRRTGEPPRTDEASRLQAALRTLQAENALLRTVVSIHDRLDSLVLGGEGLESIVAELAKLLKRPVLLLDPAFCTMVRQLPNATSAGAVKAVGCLFDVRDPTMERMLHVVASERRPLRVPPAPEHGLRFGCVLAPILGDEAPLGYLAIVDGPSGGRADPGGDEAALLLAGHAAAVCALALARTRQEGAVTAQLRDELLDSLLLGETASAEAARERAQRLGYDESKQYRVLFVALEEPAATHQPRDAGEAIWAAARRRRLLAGLARLAEERVAGAIVAEREEGLVLLLPEQAATGANDLGRGLILQAAALEPQRALLIGVGAPCRSATDVARSFRQARRAIEIGRRFGRRGEVVEFAALGLYRLLFQVSDRAELDAYVEQVLGPLLAYDRRHHTELVRTLATYLEHNSAVQATARALTIHVNTASYRLQRIEAISGLDLSQAEDRLQARVALKILHGCEPE
jgi:sugar diacid utilization regulator